MKKSIYNHLKKCPPAFEVFKKLEQFGNLYLIGGVLREYKDHKYIQELRDIDIVVDAEDKKSCKEMLGTYNPRKNSFGGYKIDCKGLIVDIWFLDETWAYREGIVECPREQYGERLTDTVFLNIDGIAYDWNKEIWKEEKYDEAMRSEEIDIVLGQNPQIKLNIIRAMVLRRRYNFSFSERLKTVIRRQVESSNNLKQELYQIQIERYKKDILSMKEIEKELTFLFEESANHDPSKA